MAPQLAERAQKFRETAPSDIYELYEWGVEQVRQAGITEQAQQVGDRAPDFTLTNATGKQVALPQLLSKGPVVIVWYRGGWCPYCNLTLRSYQKRLDEIQKLGATLVAISPETPDNSLDTKSKNQLPFEVLSDSDNQVARAYGLVFQLPEKIKNIYQEKFDLARFNGNDKGELPLAATYVVDKRGVIRYAFLDPDYRKRAEPDEVLNALKQIAAHN